MSSSQSNAVGADWTALLADPDLARNLGKLLQTYRDAPPERREQALLAAMREIKCAGSKTTDVPLATKTGVPQTASVPVRSANVPPFEPESFSANWRQERRR